MKFHISVNIDDILTDVVIPYLRHSLRALEQSPLKDATDYKKDVKALKRTLDFYGAKP